MKKILGWLGFLAIFSNSAIAFGQEPLTLATAIAKGAKKLGAEDVKSLMTGATISGLQRNRPQTRFELEYKADGTVSGGAMDANRPTNNAPTNYTSVSGTWRINDAGQSCVDLRNSFGQRPTSTDACSTWYLLDGNYYHASSNDPSTIMLVREVKSKNN